MLYTQYANARETSQSEAILGSSQVQNNAGGYGWAVDDWKRLDRFLILGAEGGTYYASERKLTRDNAEAVLRCIKADGPRTVNRVVEISRAGRAPKNEPALFALAMCAGLGAPETRKRALACLPLVARTGTHLFHFAEYAQAFRGWGRGLRQAVARWYDDKETDDLAYQVVKYRQRDGWTHRDLLRLSHPKPAHASWQALYRWITQGEAGDALPRIVQGYLAVQVAETEREVVRLIGEYGLPREALDTKWLKSPDVWAAMLPDMPLTAMIRNLGVMTANGLLAPLSDAERTVVGKLADSEHLRKSRVHPIAVLSALMVYRQGHGARGSLEWSPSARAVDALNSAFYAAFGNVTPTGRRLVLGIDVSGSMESGEIAGIPGLTPRMGAAAMALVTANVESNYAIMGFSHQFVDLAISPRQRLDDVMRTMAALDFGATDCALPMLWALGYQPKRGAWRCAAGYERAGRPVDADAFIVYTDNETWYGSIHPSQALQRYRQERGIAAKLAVVAMTADGFTIADPNDAGMLDVVGFDTATPELLSQFIRDT
jgi:60 kDa SS-A/Ro ribonucleoprotein